MISIRLLCISFAIVIPFVSTNGNSSNTLPCAFHDSINITAGIYNGSKIIFDGITFGPDQYATVESALDEKSNLVPVKSHIRGCICNIKTCIRTCCPHGHIRVNNKTATADCVRNDEVHNSHFPIKMENGTFPAKDRFTIVHSKPPGCERLVKLHDYWINHTGEAIIGKMLTKLNHSRYCINYDFNAATKVLTENLLFCEEPEQSDSSSDFDNRTVPYLLLLSIPFLIATILVYRFVPELYNLHGKCLLWYLTSLIFAFAVTAIIKLDSSMSLLLCHTTGWIMYLAYIAAFLWLSVICYDLWSTIRATKGYQRYSDGRLFIYYFAYAVGLSVTLTIIAMVMNYSELVPASWRPQIGNQICFIREKFAKGLYFYGPMAIIFSINVVLFLSTVLQIRQLQRNSASEVTNEIHNRNLKTNGEKCFLYLQLFVVMGIPWIMEVLAFFFETFHGKISRIFDVINAIQGLLIFALLVLRPRTRELIKKRWQQYKGVEGVNTMSDPKESNPLSMTQVD